MMPSHPKILINELVITDTNAGSYMTKPDINMMCMLAGMERSEKQWRDLLDSVGLQLVKIWTKEASSKSIIECELK